MHVCMGCGTRRHRCTCVWGMELGGTDARVYGRGEHRGVGGSKAEPGQSMPSCGLLDEVCDREREWRGKGGCGTCTCMPTPSHACTHVPITHTWHAIITHHARDT